MLKAKYTGLSVLGYLTVAVPFLLRFGANARLKKYLMDDPAIPEIDTMEQAKQYLKDRCYFQYIEEDDMRKRGQRKTPAGSLRQGEV